MAWRRENGAHAHVGELNEIRIGRGEHGQPACCGVTTRGDHCARLRLVPDATPFWHGDHRPGVLSPVVPAAYRVMT